VFVTPDCFIQPVLKRLDIRGFSHDFAADASNTKAPFYWDEAGNSLRASPAQWAERCCGGWSVWGWLNPPFAHIAPWAKRCAETRALGGQIALLTPAAIGSNWFRDFVKGHAFVLALNGRIPFMPDKPEWGYPKDCILSLYGPRIVPGFDVWTWKPKPEIIAAGGQNEASDRLVGVLSRASRAGTRAIADLSVPDHQLDTRRAGTGDPVFPGW
jgi:hypothetical protein